MNAAIVTPGRCLKMASPYSYSASEAPQTTGYRGGGVANTCLSHKKKGRNKKNVQGLLGCQASSMTHVLIFLCTYAVSGRSTSRLLDFDPVPAEHAPRSQLGSRPAASGWQVENQRDCEG